MRKTIRIDSGQLWDKGGVGGGNVQQRKETPQGERTEKKRAKTTRSGGAKAKKLHDKTGWVLLKRSIHWGKKKPPKKKAGHNERRNPRRNEEKKNGGGPTSLKKKEGENRTAGEWKKRTKRKNHLNERHSDRGTAIGTQRNPPQLSTR